MSCWFVTMLSCLCLAFVGEGRLTLSSSESHENSVIVLPTGASPSERHAAEELRDFTERITGERMKIADDNGAVPLRGIFLGVTQYTETILGEAPEVKSLGTDGFRIVARWPHLLVVGSSVRGVLYGVYEILERFGGVGWYASWHAVIPKSKELWVPKDLDLTQIPAIALRVPYWRDVKGDFAARLRANGSFQNVGRRNGGAAFGFGGGLGVCHTFDTLLPPKRFFDEHPEFYSFRKKTGKRLGESTQLCLANPDVLRIVTSNVIERIRSDPGALCYGVSQNDNTNYCECERCAEIDEEEGSHAGTMIRFVNAVAESVEREFPGKIIETLAYEYTRKPPKKTRLRPNVMPCLCTSGCDFSQPIVMSLHSDTRAFLDDITGWGRQTRQLYIWDYTTNFRHYPHEFPNVYALQGNLQLFRDNHAIGILAQGDFTGWHASFGELKAWLISKWMWDPDLPADALIDRFFAGYYGKAAAPLVRQYFDSLYSEVRAAAKQSSEDPLIMYADIGRMPPSDELVRRGAELWREAARRARQSDPDCFYNVAMGSAALDYTLAMRHVYPRTRTDPKTKRTQPLLFLTKDASTLERFSRAKEAAQRFCVALKAASDRGHRIVLNEHWNKEWEDIVKGTASRPYPAADRLTLSYRHLKQSGTNECAIVDVEDGNDGKALLMRNSHWNWCATFGLDGVQFDGGEKVTVRIRVRVDKRGDSSGTEAFSAGVYDRMSEKCVGEIRIPVSKVSEGWTWYDVATLEPGQTQFLWIAPGRFDRTRHTSHPAISGVIVDQIEFIRTEDKPKMKQEKHHE